MFRGAGCTGSVHVVRLGDGVDVGHAPDELHVMASIVKVPIALEFYDQVRAGRLDPSEQLTLRPETVTPGPVGISRFHEDVSMSLRDLAYLMLTISDNAATDALARLVTIDSVNARLATAGCERTILLGTLLEMLDSVAEDLGFARYTELLSAQRGDLGDEARAAAVDVTRTNACRALDPASASRTTARDFTTLLTSIWNDTAAAPDACSVVRAVMSEQVTQRLRPAVPEGGSLAAKSGGLFGRVRNEVGVVADTDGEQFAFAVLTRAAEPFVRQSQINATMAEVVRLAIAELQGA